MKWFLNMKIRGKLIACFIVLAIFTAIVGIVGINNMNTLNNASIKMNKEDFQPSIDLSKIQTYLQQVRSDHLLLLYERDVTKFQERVDEITKLAEEANQLLSNYEKTILEDKENQKLYETLMENLANYRTLRDHSIGLIEEKKYDEAISTLSNVSVSREAVDKSLQDLVDYKTNTSAKTIKANTESFQRQTILMITVMAIGILLAVLFGMLLATMISKQLNRLVKAANRIADGDLDVTIDVYSKDEVGILAKAFKKMTDNVNQVMTNINSAAEQVASGSKQVSDSSMALSQGATEQASSIEELTASLEEISSQTKLNAQNANQANDLAEVARDNAEHGNLQMNEMLKSMEDINDSSSNISKIIKVIDEIAFQTNILALNAAVEAARAGQHGKGFAVVAEEVRNLAARSANAAKETTDMIEGSIKKVEIGTKIANETADALTKIVADVTKAASLVGDIAVASNEQALGIEQINQGIMQISEVIQTNSATSEESASASEELSSQALLLREMVGNFKLKQNTTNYNSIDNLSPDVLNMLENMAEKNRNPKKRRKDQEETTVPKPQITLNDNEFGKY
ncbi:methyl-accepting chemotaxis protein [Anaerocolumna sp. MB42-C2]|uniref:methyl-accepting chemotaxis protein n=1 Tax=Anaerocolumna sp. MB42-C2 TaxID=3070997 RepID=UPI0027E0EC74|nr:methyl-accepting chemotaxis protein [Anaerocolumna sp. MB42-C2]WMJ87670.1 methyl-accepting chemotaxis protein [Anaerocolumna sp. MB42-C2]